MTTFTITEAQRQQLLASYDTSQSLSHDPLDHLTRIDGCWDLLQSLEPVNAEPVAWVAAAHTFGSTAKGIYGWQDLPIGTKLYTHPAPMRILTDAERLEREKARAK